MKLTAFHLTLFLLVLIPNSLFSKEYNILNYGALSDSSFLSTPGIQKAIDECTANGGGTVIVPAGSYKTGTIILKSNVNLHLEAGAILYGSTRLNDYIKIKPGYLSLRTQEATIQLIYAENAENVSISGFGIINGRGRNFKKLSWNDEGITRPHLIRFITCKQVTIENITLWNSGCWMQHYLACDNLHIRGVKVFNRNNFNNDGLDLDGCRNVTVSDFISDSDDDGITLKSTSPRPCENITITNCVISSRCNAIKLGTESNGGFKNICISNCVVKPSELVQPAFYGHVGGTAGIALEIVDGGVMKGISISNIYIDGTESPIFIRLANRARPYKKDMVIDHVGVLSDVNISHVQVKNAGQTGCSITGLPGHPVENIHFSDISMEQTGGKAPNDSAQYMEEKEKDYPEATMFGILPAYGFYIRHASNISFEDIRLSTKEEDLRPAFYGVDLKQGVFSDMQLQSSDATKDNICLTDSRDVVIKGNIIRGKSACFVHLSGAKNSDITIINNLVNETQKLYKADLIVEKLFDFGNIIQNKVIN
jgi:polygalacturonase